MRWTGGVSVWPVGTVGRLLYEAPIVTEGVVIGWRAAYRTDRKYPVDMAGFAVNTQLLQEHPAAMFDNTVLISYSYYVYIHRGLKTILKFPFSLSYCLSNQLDNI